MSNMYPGAPYERLLTALKVFIDMGICIISIQISRFFVLDSFMNA
jgi:hypothetical protein